MDNTFEYQGLNDKRIPEKYIPSFEYYKIVEKDIPDEVLLRLHNLISAIIYLEKRKDEKGLKEAITKVIELIKDENIINLRMFTIWLKRMVRQKVDIENFDKITNLMEVKNMLTAIADEIMQKGIEKRNLEIAKKMKEEGIDYALISKITDLSIDEISKL